MGHLQSNGNFQGKPKVSCSLAIKLVDEDRGRKGISGKLKASIILPLYKKGINQNARTKKEYLLQVVLQKYSPGFFSFIFHLLFFLFFSFSFHLFFSFVFHLGQTRPNAQKRV